MSEVNDAPLLVVAGVRNEVSLGQSSVNAWLERDPNNCALVTVHSNKALDYVKAQEEATNGRVIAVQIDWTDADVENNLFHSLNGLAGVMGRRVGGVVHAIANAPPENFNGWAHNLGPEVYNDTYAITAESLIRLAHVTSKHLRPEGGIVTFGFGEPGRVIEEYGPALSIAKIALSQAVSELAVSMGQKNPPARTLEIVTGYIPTYAGRGVALAQRLRPQVIAQYFAEASPLKTADSDKQRIAAGQLAVSFMLDPWFGQTTGERIHVDGGFSIRGGQIFPRDTVRER